MSQSVAAIFDGTPRTIGLQKFDIPQPQGREVLVRVLGCTLCGSDLHSYTGRRQVPCPTVLGHEIVGEIAEFGDRALRTDITGQPLAEGDRVTWAIVAACGECFLCRRGLPQKCLHAVKYGHEALHPGRELVGGLADHCLLVPGTAIVRLPDEIPLSVACPASCATSTIAASLEAAGELRDRTVVITGAGLLGLTACAMAHVSGAEQVICIEPDAERRKLAATFGATHTAGPEELAALVKELTHGHGADVLVELSGATAALEAAWPVIRLGGTFVLVGAVFPGAPLTWPVEQVVRRNLTIRGVHNYAPQHLVQAVQFLSEQHWKFPFAQLAADWYPLAEVETAFAQALQPGHVRIGVSP